MDPIQQIHLDLRQNICGDLVDQSDEFNNLIAQMERLVGKGNLSRKKTLQDKFGALETRGHLKPGDYKILRDIIVKSNNHDLLRHIDTAEEEIRRLKGTTEQESEPTVLYSRGQKRTVEDNGTAAEINNSKRPAPDTQQPSSSSNSDHADPANSDEYYNIDKAQRGYLLILNSSENRTGTQYDVEELTKLFKDELKFEVDEPRSLEEQDFNKEELIRHLEEIRFKLNLQIDSKKYYCFICIILSHGDQKGIRTREGGFISVEQIRRMFNNRQIPTFTGRPKLFFVQACRGQDTQDGVEHVDEEDDASAVEDEGDVRVKLPSDADTLIAFSTTPGWKSFRRTQGAVKGSWFIQECVQVFRANRKTHVEDLLVKVRHNVAKNWETGSGGKQMPCVWTTLTKKLVLK